MAITREIARGRGSEVPLEIIGCEVWDVRDGLVVRFRGFRDEAQAAAALGPLR